MINSSGTNLQMIHPASISWQWQLAFPQFLRGNLERIRFAVVEFDEGGAFMESWRRGCRGDEHVRIWSGSGWWFWWCLRWNRQGCANEKQQPGDSIRRSWRWQKLKWTRLPSGNPRHLLRSIHVHLRPRHLRHPRHLQFHCIRNCRRRKWQRLPEIIVATVLLVWHSKRDYTRDPGHFLDPCTYGSNLSDIFRQCHQAEWKSLRFPASQLFRLERATDKLLPCSIRPALFHARSPAESAWKALLAINRRGRLDSDQFNLPWTRNEQKTRQNLSWNCWKGTENAS